MFKHSNFDEVHDCQGIFKLLLYAIANPGAIVNIGPYAKNLEEQNRAMLSLAWTLLDRETDFMVAGNRLFAETVVDLTNARLTQENAQFIFILDHCSRKQAQQIFSRATPGTEVDPHTGSSLFIAVDNFDPSVSCLLNGPGIKGSKRVAFAEYGRRWVRERDVRQYEYPTGIDLFFVTPQGALMALPRRVNMEG